MTSIPSSRIRIGIVGCGAVSEQLHLPALMARKDVDTTAAIDRNPERANLIAKAAQAKAFSSVAEALPHIDAAIVALPHNLHAPVSIELLEAGKHVLVEKPMAVTVKECDAMIAAAKKGKASLAVGQMRRFCPSVAHAKQALEAGRIGKIRRFEIREGNIYDWPVASDFFFRKETAGGGVLMDTGAHTFDMLLWYFGDALDLDYRDDSFGGVEADCEVRFRTRSGADGYCELSRTRNLATELLVEGETGRMVISYKTNQFSVQKGDSWPKITRFATNDSEGKSVSIWQLMIIRQLENWVRSLRNEEPLLVPGEEGRKVVEFIERCYAGKGAMALPWMKP